MLSKRTREREESEREKGRMNEKEGRGKRDYVVRERERERGRTCIFYLLERMGPLAGAPLTAVSLISAQWGPPIGHMKAKKPKVVVDLVLHRPLN